MQVTLYIDQLHVTTINRKMIDQPSNKILKDGTKLKQNGSVHV